MVNHALVAVLKRVLLPGGLHDLGLSQVQVVVIWRPLHLALSDVKVLLGRLVQVVLAGT